MESNCLELVSQEIDNSINHIVDSLNDLEIRRNISYVVSAVIATLRKGNKILLCGNGGSAADSQHIAAEFVSRFNFDRPALPAIALTTDTSALTAIGNDYGFDYIFSRQVEAIGKPGDIVFAYTTSGKSKNIINALIAASKLGITTVVLTGNNYTPLSNYANFIISVNSLSTPKIQEAHAIIGHTICSVVEELYFGKS